MTNEEVIEIITKEFTFVKFIRVDNEYDKGYYYRQNNVQIQNSTINNDDTFGILLTIVTLGEGYPKIRNIIQGEDIIEKLYEYLPMEFYLPYLRDGKIIDILN